MSVNEILDCSKDFVKGCSKVLAKDSVKSPVKVLPKGFLIFCLIIVSLSAPSLSEPGLNLTKSCDVMFAYFGDTVTYTFSLENNGSEAIRELEIMDDHLGSISLDDDSLDPGERCLASVSYAINESDIPGPLINTARARGSSALGYVLSNNASFVVSLGVSGYENLSKIENLRMG